ncbi:MAG: hypothetical protein IJP70_00085 [Bacteroidales bacterium]|nr:hypothetical protein [Bacteroidales bacterium]
MTDKLKPKYSACLFTLLFAPVVLLAQTDITGSYLQNPSFESDDISKLSFDDTRGAYKITQLTGWSLTGSYGVSDIMTASATATDNNFGTPGKPSDGSQMYYIRNAWTAGNASLKQNIQLPAGKYRLTVDHKCITASSHSVSLCAGTENTALSFQSTMPSQWTTAAIDFKLDAEATVSVGIDITWGSGSGGSILLDNFKLYDVSSEVVVADPTETEVDSPTEGKIDNQFVPEAEMMNDLLQMLAKFSTYLVNDYQACVAPNSIGEQCGCFKGESTMANNEAGVRTNADLSMICAFLVKYAQPQGIELPSGVTYDVLADYAMKTLVFAYSTHKANKLKVCSGNNYWGSVSGSDHVWESSLWAMSVAYSAYFQWDKLSDAQKGYIYNLLKAECNYELNRTIPTGYAGDTKSEENGWEADVLAATLGLFPDDALADQWFERMRAFAINSYSHFSDASNQQVIDESYNAKTVADLYAGNNLYSDYTLQNHNLFHTSYQNVVMQELGEAALALRLFQGDAPKWQSNALMHNNQAVMDEVLNWLALADGELAMPNGNDWSLFLYDQITSYSTMATFLQDPNVLLLENLAYKQIKARQTTTDDGSWLLRPDVSARRMGVEAHRVMMTYLMHLQNPTAQLTPARWDDFRNAHSAAKIFPCQNIVRAYTPDRFTTFSWSEGLKSYTGYFAPDCADKNKIIVPYRANNTGNITGWYEVSGKGTNATPVVNGIYQLDGNSYVMNGELNTNDASLNNRFALYSTPQNAILYLDYVTANADVTITAEKGGLLAISTDELTKLKRTLYFSDGDSITHRQSDGSSLISFTSDWVNIDNELGIVGKNGKKVAFGDRSANNSIYTSKLYPMYSSQSRKVQKGEQVDARGLIYYSRIDAARTDSMSRCATSLLNLLPAGWNGLIAPDRNCAYLLISHFQGNADTITLSGLQWQGYAPVLKEVTAIDDNRSSVRLTALQNHSFAQPLSIGIRGTGITAQQESDSSAFVWTSSSEATIQVVISLPGSDAPAKRSDITIPANRVVRIFRNAENGIEVEFSELPVIEQKDYTGWIVNPKFEGNSSFGWTESVQGSITTNYNEAERFNANLNIRQNISGLPAGKYLLSCQGFYRAGSYANAASANKAGTEKRNALLYADTETQHFSTPLVSIFEGAGQLGKLGASTSLGYIPDNMEQASQYFGEGLYENSLEVSVGSDGKLTIGIKKESTITNDWTIFTHFRLVYLGADETGLQIPVTRKFSNLISRLDGTTVSSTDRLQTGIYIVNGRKSFLHTSK